MSLKSRTDYKLDLMAYGQTYFELAVSYSMSYSIMKRLCLINTKRNGVKQRKVLLGLLLTNKNIWINYIQVLAETTAVFRCVVIHFVSLTIGHQIKLIVSPRL